MPNLFTDADMRDEITSTLDACGEDIDHYDVRGITDDLIRDHGVVRIDTIDGDVFWPLVLRHRIGDGAGRV